MAISDRGYETLREYIVSPDGWRYIAILDDTGDIIARVDTDSDTRATWSDPSENPIVCELEITGDDPDVSFAGDLLEVSGTALYEDSISETPVDEEEFGEAGNVTIAEDDSLTVEHTIDVPR